MQMILQLFIQKGLKVLFDWKYKAFFYTQLHLFTYFLKRLCIHLLFEKFGNSTQNFILGFIGTIIIMLILDLFVFHKKAHTVSNKEALGFTLFWIALAMVFSGVFYFEYGFEAFSQFQAAYWIEKALSVDNLFVFNSGF